MAAASGKLPGETVMLQATGGSSYFAFEPFLKALQRNQTLPLADHITQVPASITAAGVQLGSHVSQYIQLKANASAAFALSWLTSTTARACLMSACLCLFVIAKIRNCVDIDLQCIVCKLTQHCFHYMYYQWQQT